MIVLRKSLTEQLGLHVEDPGAQTAGDAIITMGSTAMASMGHAVLPHDFEAWARHAEPGAKLRYAVGKLPKWSKLPAMVRELDARGMIFAFHRDSVEPREYWARREAVAWTDAPKAPPRRVTRAVADRSAERGRLLALLTELAENGRPCPTNRELARLAEIDGTRACIAWLLGSLEAAGLIVRISAKGDPRRVFAIVGTDLKTAGEAA